MKPDAEREADRLIIQADELRRIANDLEARAATLRPSRTPLNHGKLFDQLADRQERGEDPFVEWDGAPRCAYCQNDLHPHDPSHSLEFHEQLEGIACVVDGGLIGRHERCAQIDHVLPVRQGGLNHIDNLVLACRPCNQAKRDRTPMQWAIDAANTGYADLIASVEPLVIELSECMGEPLHLKEVVQGLAEAFALFSTLAAQARSGDLWPDKHRIGDAADELWWATDPWAQFAVRSAIPGIRAEAEVRRREKAARELEWAPTCLDDLEPF